MCCTYFDRRSPLLTQPTNGGIKKNTFEVWNEFATMTVTGVTVLTSRRPLPPTKVNPVQQP
jgi:hypothetical protein